MPTLTRPHTHSLLHLVFTDAMIASQHNAMATASLSEFARILGPTGTLFLVSLTPPEKILPFLSTGCLVTSAEGDGEEESVAGAGAGAAGAAGAGAAVVPSSWNLVVNEQRQKVHGGGTAAGGGEEKGEDAGGADHGDAEAKVVDYWLYVATPKSSDLPPPPSAPLPLPPPPQ